MTQIFDIDDCESEFICDNSIHTNKCPAYGQLAIHFWLGSKNDMKQGTIHLCDKCAENIIFLIKKELKIKDFLKPIEEL
jgi:hypothetical protein